MSATSPGLTLSALRAFAEAENLPLHELACDGGRLVITPTWGGRILFAGAGEDNAFWTNPDFHATGTWGWNKGGARTWFSPEGGNKGIYFSADWKDWQCPAAMDPGNYVVKSQDETHIDMANEFKATTNDGTNYHLSMGRSIALTCACGIDLRLKAIPIQFSHSYTNLGETTIQKEIDLWHLIQTVPGGTILVPVNDKTEPPAYRNYFQPIPEERVAEQGGCVSVKIDGALRYKLGVHQLRSTGKIAYARPVGDNKLSMLIKIFEVDPTGVYADRPEVDQVTNGDPVQLYNHDTSGPEGFGEIECHAPAIELAPGQTQTFDIKMVMLEGERDLVLAQGGALLERNLSQVKLFA